MTPAEQARHEAQAAARTAARAKWGDGAAVIEDADLKHFSAAEILALVNAGRIPNVGPDKRLRR